MELLLLFWLIAAVVVIVTLVFLLGFRLGAESWPPEGYSVQAQSAAAEQALFDLTRQAFVAMSEEAMRRRGGMGS